MLPQLADRLAGDLHVSPGLRKRKMITRDLDIISATSPLHGARNTTLFYLPDRDLLPSLQSLLQDTNIKDHLLCVSIRTCLQVIFLYGLRSAEALGIRNADWIGAERWFVPGAKGSRGVVCFLPGSTKWHIAAKALRPELPLFPISYSELYRACVKIGIGQSLVDHENLARTHSSRYLIARQVAARCGASGAQDALRHKRATSTAYYL